MPWREVAASMPRAEDSDARVPKFVPDSYFELQHVLGYSGDHLKDNVHYLSNGKPQTPARSSVLSTCIVLPLNVLPAYHLVL
jgi:hypothetical protein